MSQFLTPRTAGCVAALILALAAPAANAQDDAAQPPAAEAPAAEAAPAETVAPAEAEAPPRNPTDVVAKVGDSTITEADLVIARQEFGNELGGVEESEQRGLLIDALVNMELFAQAARDAGLEQSPGFEQRLEFLKTQALRNLFVEQSIVGTVTSEDLQKGYERLVLAEHKPEEEVHARHILVDSKEEAEKIIADLKGGASFEELAKQSKDPSGQNGGDLGFFGRGQMVPPFEEAAFALEPGKITEQPVQSEFGWHVIRLEEKRMSEPPALADLEDELRNYLLREKFQTALTELRNKYPVDVVGQPAPAEGGGPAGAPAEGADAPAEAPAVEEPAAEEPTPN
jgi:peptidyl-prolyl cis-trans isomerase C